MRILHVLSSARAEGTPKLVLDWLGDERHQQSVLLLSESGELLNDFRSKTTLHTNQSFAPSFKSAFKIAELVKNVCLKEKPDLLIAWPTGHSQWIHWGAKKAGVEKKITHIGNPPGNTFFGRYIATAITFWPSYLLGVKFIACSQYVSNCYKKFKLLPSRNIYYAYNAIHLDVFNAGEGKLGTVMVATLEKHKDHDTLLQAAADYPSRTGEVRCYGAGSLKEVLNQKIERLGIENQIKLEGSVNNIPEILSNAKVFVLSTTENEGFGTVLIEALASGCHVVATKVEATKEVLQNGKWGVLVEKKNPKDLADAIFEASNKDKLSGFDVQERSEYLKQFTVEAMIDAYLNIANA